MEGGGVEEREWVMTGTINFGADLKLAGVVRASPATSEADEAVTSKRVETVDIVVVGDRGAFATIVIWG